MGTLSGQDFVDGKYTLKKSRDQIWSHVDPGKMMDAFKNRLKKISGISESGRKDVGSRRTGFTTLVFRGSAVVERFGEKAVIWHVPPLTMTP